LAVRTAPAQRLRTVPAASVFDRGHPDATAWDSQDADVVMIQQNMNTLTHPLHVAYPNACVIVPSLLDGALGFYMARVYEGSSAATMLTIWGREIWGFPKIAGDSNVTRDGQRTTSYLRAGHASADVVLELTGEEHTEPATTLRLYCRKTIPSADGRGLDLDRIIEVPWHQTIERRLVGTVERCDVKIDVPGGAVALPVKEVLQAFWYSQEPGTVLDKGKVVFDYLA
jgi:acetoacetate decarboxylase